MDNISISIKTPDTKTLAVTQVYQKEQTAPQNSDKSNNAKEASSSVQVEISEEAKEKSLQDSNQQAHRKLMGKEEVDKAQDADETLTLDEMIAELQEEIAQLSQEMAKLRAQGDEQSTREAKSLEIQIAMLTAQLIELLTQKIEQNKHQ